MNAPIPIRAAPREVRKLRAAVSLQQSARLNFIMAKSEHDREDLIGEAKNLSIRGATQIGSTEVVVGFRDQGQLSVFAGPDPVYQFNTNKELRRVFFDGVRYAAQQGELVQLDRTRRGGKVTFTQSTLSQQQTDRILRDAAQWLHKLRHAANDDEASWKTANDNADELRQRLQTWLADFPGDASDTRDDHSDGGDTVAAIKIANQPNA